MIKTVDSMQFILSVASFYIAYHVTVVTLQLIATVIDYFRK